MNSSKRDMGSEFPRVLLGTTHLKSIQGRITTPPMQPDRTWSPRAHWRMQPHWLPGHAQNHSWADGLNARSFEALEPLGLIHTTARTGVHVTWRLLTHRSILIAFEPKTPIIFYVILKETFLLPSDQLSPYKASTDHNPQLGLDMCHLKGQAEFLPVFCRHFQASEVLMWRSQQRHYFGVSVIESSRMDRKGGSVI